MIARQNYLLRVIPSLIHDSDIVSDIPSGSHSFWHIHAYTLTLFLAFYLASILTYLLVFYLAFFLAFYLAYLLTFFLAFYLAYLLTFYLTSFLTFFPLRSGSAHCDLEVAIEVRGSRG